MSLKRLKPENQENFTIVVSPKTVFVSSSFSGSSGGFSFYANNSRIRKALQGSSYLGTPAQEAGYSAALQALQKPQTTTNLTSHVQNYLAAVSAVEPLSTVSNVEIDRYRPGTDLTETFLKKRVIRETYCPWYAVNNFAYQWAVRNYHCLSFRRGSSLPTGSALLYPVLSSSNVSGTAVGALIPNDALTLRFQINPRVSSISYPAGTIAHLSSTYKFSLVSGSSIGEDGMPLGFRILAQFSSSADIPAATVTPGSGTGIYAVLSDDNALSRGDWHDVVFRWGANQNAGTGTILVDNQVVGSIPLPFSSMRPQLGSKEAPQVLSLGASIIGPNFGTSSHSLYFSGDVGEREGLQVLNSTIGVDYPASSSVQEQLSADMHGFEVFHAYKPLSYISSTYIGDKVKETSLGEAGLVFKVGPKFREEAPFRKFVGTYGGVPVTPFQTQDDTTSTPFNIDMSFSVDGFLSNLENYVRDPVGGLDPRLLELSCSIIEGYSGPETANSILYGQKSVVARNGLIRPCDDGNWVPDYSDIGSYTSGSTFGVLRDWSGAPDPSLIYLGNLISGSVGSDPLQEMYYPTPENPTQAAHNSPTIYRRTGDASSNEVSLFDVSSLFYSTRIRPGTLKIRDVGLSGSATGTQITLCDNGTGGLYRADTTGSPAPWANVGFVLYDEGQIVVLDPTINHFGKTQFRLEFKGEKRIHTTKFDAELNVDQSNFSVNPTFANAPKSEDVTLDADHSGYVYISEVNIHDDEYDVVMRARLAKPIKKYTGDKMVIKLSYDW